MTVAARQQARADRQAMQAAQSAAEREQIAAAINSRSTPSTSPEGQRVMARVANSEPSDPILPDGTRMSEMAAPLRAKHKAQAAAMRDLPNREAAIRAAKILRDKEGEWSEERLAAGWEKVNRYVAAHPEEFEKPPEPKTREELMLEEQNYLNQIEGENRRQFVDQYVSDLYGMGTVAASIANSAIAEPAAGAAALGNMVWNYGKEFFTGKDIDINDRANEVLNEWRESMTFVSPSAEGQQFLETVAEPLTVIDEKVKNFSERAGFGNVWASTAIYSTILGAFEIAGLKGARSLKTTQKLRDASALTEALNVPPVAQTMPSDIVRAARDMAPAQRAANAGQLREGLVAARKAEAEGLEALRRRVNDRPAYLNTDDAQMFAREFRERAEMDGWDLEKMPTLSEHLDEIENIPFEVFGAQRMDVPVDTAPGNARIGRQTQQARLENQQPRLEGQTYFGKEGAEEAAQAGRKADTEGATAAQRTTHLREWVKLRNRLEKSILTNRGRNDLPLTLNEKQRMKDLMTTMDNALEKQFHSDMISGTPEALEAWKTFDVKRTNFNRNFNADKTILKLMDMEASPTQMKRWLLGANAVKQAGMGTKTLERLKEVLGRDHPAIEGIRQDYIYDVMAPLLKDKPDFQAYINNVDHILKEQPDVLKALDLTPEQFSPLRNLAKLSLKHPPSKPIAIIKDYAQAFSRLTIGHAIARAGMRVSMVSNLVKKLMGADPKFQRRLLAEFAEAQFGGPVINKHSRAAGQIIEAATYADLTGLVTDEEVEPQK